MTVEEFVALVRRGENAVFRFKAHQVDYLPGDSGVLVVTFEPAAATKVEPDLDRPVWGQTFLRRRGHAVLGVKRESSDWYRDPELHRLFRALQAAAWFAGFRQVMFYGPSMGGYAALAFAACAPGCTVLAMHPQSTLAPDRIWFDQRFAARAKRWRGDFVDGIDGAAVATRVYVCFDPWQIKDRLHVQRLPPHNRVDLRLPYVGHATSQSLQRLGLLGSVFDQALAGTLDAAGFKRMARERVRLAEYQFRLAERGVWKPRRLHILGKALQIDPQHSAALRLRHALVPQVSSAAGRAEPPPPRRWPMGIVTADRVPLVYLNLPKCAGTTIQNHLLYIARGRYAENPGDIYQHDGLCRSREDRDETHDLITRQIRSGALIFTFVRHPGRRAYACFTEKIAQTGRNSFAEVRRALQSDWGLRLPGVDEPTPLELQRENFEAFLRFVEANLAGDTEIRRDPHWSPQTPMLAHYRKHLKIDVVGRVEAFAAEMAVILHRAGVRRIPDVRWRPWRHAVVPYSYDEVITPALQERLERIYERDFRHLGYQREPE
ncbi:sulfotransferase family 2 domain-containing protein [Ideonella sp.]|uniref:sulfotransferase family 2 domain-containing protein n=1 Tax=Ideonella sp. TaxID=1929293 RepID=UPI0035B1FBBC